MVQSTFNMLLQAPLNAGSSEVADAIQEELKAEDYEDEEVEEALEEEAQLLEVVRGMLGLANCNDEGCCNCSRQDKDGNAKVTGGTCRVKKPVRKNNSCNRGKETRWCPA